MWIAEDWKDYELLDCGGGEKLERWDKQFLVRPDPQAIWETPRKNPAWKRANARYLRSQTGGGHWEKKTLPESWKVHYKDLTFQVKPMNFKHTGLFPEQAVNWDFAMEKIYHRPDHPPGRQRYRRHAAAEHPEEGLRRGSQYGTAPSHHREAALSPELQTPKHRQCGKRSRQHGYKIGSYVPHGRYSLIQRPVAPQGRAIPVSVTGRPNSSQVHLPPYFSATSRCSRYPRTEGARPVV